MKRLISIINEALCLAAVPFLALGVFALYIAWLLGGNPRTTTFEAWLAQSFAE